FRSCIFEAGRDPESVQSGDNNFNPVKYAKNRVDTENQSATSSVFGLKPRTAIYLEGLGCTLLPEGDDNINTVAWEPLRQINRNEIPYPYGVLTPIDTEFSDIDYEKLDRKSTRLNSSHVKISYAVFCLKKKMNGIL